MNVLCYVQARFCLVGDPKHMAWDELDDLDVSSSFLVLLEESPSQIAGTVSTLYESSVPELLSAAM
jgi:hypothetical protein